MNVIAGLSYTESRPIVYLYKSKAKQYAFASSEKYTLRGHNRIVLKNKNKNYVTYIQLDLERLDRFAHHNGNPFTSRRRVSRIHRHWRNLRGPS